MTLGSEFRVLGNSASRLLAGPSCESWLLGLETYSSGGLDEMLNTCFVDHMLQGDSGCRLNGHSFGPS